MKKFFVSFCILTVLCLAALVLAPRIPEIGGSEVFTNHIAPVCFTVVAFAIWGIYIFIHDFFESIRIFISTVLIFSVAIICVLGGLLKFPFSFIDVFAILITVMTTFLVLFGLSKKDVPGVVRFIIFILGIVSSFVLPFVLP